jgi:hypothetical protein
VRDALLSEDQFHPSHFNQDEDCGELKTVHIVGLVSLSVGAFREE